MLRNVFAKTLRDRRKALIWWAVGVFGYMLLLAAAYPTVGDQREELEKLIESYPEALLAMLGVAPGQDLFSPEGYIASQATALFVPLAFAILAAAMGSRAIAGEEEDNTIDLLLANPIKRSSVVIQKFASMVAAVTSLGVVLFFSIWIGEFFEMGIPAENIGAMCLSAVLLSLVFGSAALAAGGFSGRRGITLAAASVLAVVTFLLNALGQILDWLEGARRLSPFYYYDSSQPLLNGFNWGHLAVLAALVLAGLGVSVWAFDRRDVGV